MGALDHPNIVSLYEAFEEDQDASIAMELCSGGDLFDRTVALGHLSERQAAAVMQDVIRAVSYMHGEGIVHRDLKPENFVFATRQPVEENVLKLTDFGSARHCGPGTIMRSLVGTRSYIAPQVLRRRYCRKCDVWSCGAILYTLLSGRPPFTGRTEGEVLAKVRTGRYSFEGPRWAEVSEDARRLVGALMKLNDRARCSAQALEQALARWRAPCGQRRPPAGELAQVAPWLAGSAWIERPRAAA